MSPMSRVVDGRRLLRAVALGVAVFLFVGGGVGFVVAATDEPADRLAVPEPRPGDKVVYRAQRIWLDQDLALGGTGDIRLDHVAYQWLPERWVVDERLGDRLARPLQAEYGYMSDTENALVLDRIVYYDALDGHVLFQEYDGGGWGIRNGPFYYGELPLLGPTQIGGNRFEQHYRHTEYGYTRTPCGTGATPLHGVLYDGADVVLQGRCGWEDEENQILYEPRGWTDTPAGRGHRFAAVQDGRLQMWFSSAMPFPLQLTTSSAEITDPDWAVGRMFRLTLETFTPGEGAYTDPAPEAVPPAPSLVPAPRTPWMLDDAGMEEHVALTLQEAYMAALAAPRSRPGLPQDPFQPLGQAPASQWLAAHPDGYLAAAWALEYHDDQGATLPQWIMLWVDGDAWLGKRVSWEAAGSGLILPEQMGRHLEVSDWTPSWLPADVDALFPEPHQLPASLPRPADLVDAYGRAFGGDAPLNRYGFQVYCPDAFCAEPAALVEVGRHFEDAEAVQDPYWWEPAAEDREALVDKLMVDAGGLATYQVRYIERSESLLPLPDDGSPAPSRDEAAVGGPGQLWVPPVTPATATGVSLLAVAVGALYYFWPALKGGPLVGLFSRIRDDLLLDHPTRRRIHDAVQADPGVHFQELARRLGLGHGVLDHHLHKLVRGELVTVRKAPGYTCYFPKATDRRMMDAAPVLRSGGSRSVLGAVGQRPGASSRDLAAHLGMAPSTVSYHLKRLETAGLVLPAGTAGMRLTPLGEQAKTAAA